MSSWALLDLRFIAGWLEIHEMSRCLKGSLLKVCLLFLLWSWKWSTLNGKVGGKMLRRWSCCLQDAQNPSLNTLDPQHINAVFVPFSVKGLALVLFLHLEILNPTISPPQLPLS